MFCHLKKINSKMNFRIILTLVLMFVLEGCNNYSSKNEDINFQGLQKYRNSGFALIFKDTLKENKKISEN